MQHMQNCNTVLLMSKIDGNVKNLSLNSASQALYLVFIAQVLLLQVWSNQYLGFKLIKQKKYIAFIYSTQLPVYNRYAFVYSTTLQYIGNKTDIQ